MKNVIDIQNLCKNYPTFALKEVSFSIPSGCVAGFIGLNGQGKTTTIRTMLNLAVKDKGKVFLDGFDMDHSKERQAAYQSIGVVFDEGYLYGSLTLKEMKKIVAAAYAHWDEERYRNYMTRFALNEKQKIANLSKGMRMKFALALALSHRAHLLIMDEPTSGLDPLVRNEVLNELRAFMQEDGRGILYSTHITSDLEKFADILVFINRGRIVFAEDKDAMREKFRRVKGARADLTDSVRALLKNCTVNDYGFEGITAHYEELAAAIPDLVMERVQIEDLMMFFREE